MHQSILEPSRRSAFKNLDRVLCTHDRGQDPPIQLHTDLLSSVNKMFVIWQKREQFNSFNVTGNVLTDILLANGDEPNYFARPFFFLSAF